MNVSVCIATYNGEQYLKKQLDSILPQLGVNDEIIISDDGSTDATLEIIASFHDRRITVYTTNVQSPVFNFENALIKANGTYIFLSDQDDIWMPDKVATMIRYLNHYDVVLSDCEIINQHDDGIYPSFFKYNRSHRGCMNNLIHNSYIGCCMAFKHTILSKALPFPPDIPMHDWWIGMIGEMCGKTVFIPETLIGYRRHGKNLSDSGGKSSYGILARIKFRLILIKNLLKRCYLND